MKDFWSKVWDAAKNVGKKNKVTSLKSEFDLNQRERKHFNNQLMQIFDGTKFKDEVEANMDAAVSAIDSLIKASAINKKIFASVHDALLYTQGRISSMTHAQAYQYYQHLINDQNPKPILYDYQETGFRATIQKMHLGEHLLNLFNKFIKKKKLITIIIVAFFITLVVTNPSPNDFKNHIPTIDQGVSIAVIDNTIFSSLLQISYGRKYNLGVCSIYFYHTGKTEILYIGILLNFVRI